ncbi:MAG: glycosyl transferase [Desulfobacteraceae bacterium 4484_190.3]|nr:MAG: glycosyl transferase [Desulfobacteraceae bacterium 4484_190.3]
MADLSMTEVSVIIPTFNRAHLVGRAISSVLFQAFERYEILVVDDGSTDSTGTVAKQFGSRIRYIRLEDNRGVSAARNTGIRESSSPYIAFLDSDDYWLPEKLSSQIRFFRDHPEIFICQTEELWIRKGKRVNPRKIHRKPSGDIFSPSLKLCLVSPSAVMVNRSLLDQTGHFDETLPACEDYDLWLRIAAQHPVALIKKPLVIKMGGHSDQLSRRFSGMDRFRIRSLANLLQRNILTPGQELETLEELKKKCHIYANGCLKRGRKEEGQFYLELPDKVKEGPLKKWPSRH